MKKRVRFRFSEICRQGGECFFVSVDGQEKSARSDEFPRLENASQQPLEHLRRSSVAGRFGGTKEIPRIVLGKENGIRNSERGHVASAFARDAYPSLFYGTFYAVPEKRKPSSQIKRKRKSRGTRIPSIKKKKKKEKDSPKFQSPDRRSMEPRKSEIEIEIEIEKITIERGRKNRWRKVFDRPLS